MCCQHFYSLITVKMHGFYGQGKSGKVREKSEDRGESGNL